MISEIIDDIQKEFYKALEEKTNWGRNDLKLVFERAIVTVLARHLER